MRIWNRVATDLPPLTRMKDSKRAGATTTRRDVVEDSALAKTARLPDALNTTVVRLLPLRKPEPRTVRRSPTFSVIGLTDLTVGYVAVAAEAVAGTARIAGSATASREGRR